MPLEFLDFLHRFMAPNFQQMPFWSKEARILPKIFYWHETKDFNFHSGNLSFCNFVTAVCWPRKRNVLQKVTQPFKEKATNMRTLCPRIIWLNAGDVTKWKIATFAL